MADDATLKIEIEDVSRDNPLLDEAMGKAAPKSAEQLPGPKGGPQFPATVLGPDGKQYSWDAFQAAQRKFQGQQRQADTNAAFDTFFGAKQIEPPDSVVGSDGKRYKSTDAYFKEQDRRDKEAQKDADKEAAEKEKKGTGLDGFLDTLGLGGVNKGLKAFGAEGLTTAAGAAGIAGAVLFAIHEITGSLKAMKAEVDAVTHGMEAVVQNDFAGASEAAKEFGTNLARSIPIIGEAAAAEVELGQAIISIPEKLDQAFLKQAKTLAPYSGNIAGAEARAEVAQIQADLREARELGPDLERLIDAETELRTVTRDALLPIKRFLLETLAARLEVIVTVVRVVENLPTIIEKGLDTLSQIIIFAATANKDAIDQALKIFREELKMLLAAKEPKDDIFDNFLDAARKATLPAAPFRG
jgi:hypothetical protein